MKWILLGALMALCLVYPSLLTVISAAVAWVISKPVVVAFALGLIARTHLPRMRRSAR